MQEFIGGLLACIFIGIFISIFGIMITENKSFIKVLRTIISNIRGDGNNNAN